MKLSSRSHAGSRKGLEISMTSMIDVVFLLLIFFLVTTTFIKPERQMNSNIQVEQTDAGLQTTEFEPAIVDIFQLGGQVLYKMGAVKTNDLGRIEKIMASFGDKSAGGFVRVGTDVPFGHPAKVIGAFKANGFVQVSYLPAE